MINCKLRLLVYDLLEPGDYYSTVKTLTPLTLSIKSNLKLQPHLCHYVLQTMSQLDLIRWFNHTTKNGNLIM